jgi:hypothetical protein
MATVAPNANQQIAALQRLIQKDEADGRVSAREAKAILAQAEKENVQGGELALLRNLATSQLLAPAAKDSFVAAVDQIVPAGAPTAQLAAIFYRVDPNTGRQQLLHLLAQAKNPVPQGPRTFVVTGLGRPYLAAITTAQVTSGLVKYLDGATPKQATQIRHDLNQQLDAFAKPVSQGGLSIPGILGAKGLALADDTRSADSIAINQQAVVLHALESVLALPGPANAPLVKKARGLAQRLARELKADLDFAYPAKGRLAYSLAVEHGQPITGFLEDGNHLKTTLDALKSLRIYGPEFAPVVQRIEKRLPEMAFAGPEDLGSAHGQLFTPAFEAFREAAHRLERKGPGKVTAQDLAHLQALAQKDGLLTPGERGLIARVQKLVKT